MQDKLIGRLSFSGSIVTFTQPLGPKPPSVSECSTSIYSSDFSLADIMSPRSQDVDAESDSSKVTADVASNNNHSETSCVSNSLQTARAPQHMLASDDYIQIPFNYD